MKDIDFEKIRTEALTTLTSNFDDNSAGGLAATIMEAASLVTRDMLEAYHAQISQTDS